MHCRKHHKCYWSKAEGVAAAEMVQMEGATLGGGGGGICWGIHRVVLMGRLFLTVG